MAAFRAVQFNFHLVADFVVEQCLRRPGVR